MIPATAEGGTAVAQAVIDSCEREIDKHLKACNEFVIAVGADVGVKIAGLADQIVDTLRGGGAWERLDGGVEAAERAKGNWLIVAGLKGREQAHPSSHGHVAVVVPGDLAHGKYPTGYWGSLGGEPGKNKSLNFAWNADDRDKVTYAAHKLDDNIDGTIPTA